MAVDRRSFAKSLGGVIGAALGGMSRPAATFAQAPASAAAARTAGRLAPTKVTRIRLFYPQNYDRNGPQGLPQGLVPPAEAAALTLKERAALTMAAGYRVFRVDSDILPNPGNTDSARRANAQGATFDSRSHIRLIAEAAAQIREGVGPDGNWMIDLHQKFDFHEAVEVCKLMEPPIARSSSRIRCARSSSGRSCRSCG